MLSLGGSMRAGGLCGHAKRFLKQNGGAADDFSSKLGNATNDSPE